MKKNCKFALIIIAIILTSCYDASKQTELIVNQHKIKMADELMELQQENIISESECKQLNSRLNQDLDYYLQHRDIDTIDIKNLFNATISSFENIKINQSIFSVISEAYYQIAAQRMMRDFPDIDMSFQSYTNSLIYGWFDKYQSTEDKFADLIIWVEEVREMALYPDITSVEYDTVINTIVNIQNDTTISKDALKQILIDEMDKRAGKNNDVNLFMLNIYDAIGRIKEVEVSEELSKIYEKRFTKPKVPSYTELKEEVTKYCRFMLDKDLVSRSEYALCVRTVLADIEFCEKNNDKNKVKKELLSGLRKLKIITFDTEDRETVAHWYFTLSQKRDVDISSELDKWMYDL